MKYIKTYEDTILYGETGRYYKIHVNRSFEYFDIALEKLGVKEDFYDNYLISDLTDLIDTNQEIILYNDVIYFVILDDDGDKYIFRPTQDGLLGMFRNSNIEYGGEIFVEDYEVDSRRYNL